MARGRKPSEDAPVLVVDKPKVTGRAVYWYGMLPSTEPVTFEMPTRDRDPVTGGFFKLEKFDPWKLWDRQAMPDVHFPIFAGELRQQNTLGAGGCAFSAYTNHIQALGEQIVHTPFPGGCKVMTEKEVARIIQGCYRHYVEFKSGVENRHNPECMIEVWDSGEGLPQPKESQQQNPLTMDLSAGQRKDFDALTDMYVADFVYLVRLDADWRKWPVGEFRRDPNGFYKNVVPAMDYNFFSKPPKSVAEMYPPSAS